MRDEIGRNHEQDALSVVNFFVPPKFRVSFLVCILPGTPGVLPIYDQFLMLIFLTLVIRRALNPILHEKGEKKSD